jgi:hypothetical protein
VILHAHLFQRAQRDLPILLAGPREKAQRAVAAHHDRFQHRNGKVPVQHALLRQVPDAGPVMTAQFLAGTVENLEMAGARRQQPQDRPTPTNSPSAISSEMSSSAVTPGKPNVAWVKRMIGGVVIMGSAGESG